MNFPKEFIWGSATSAYQVEGVGQGRGKSIWDTFCSVKGNVKYGHSGKEACDQFNRFSEDIRLMKECGLNSYRFSISWSRIFPDSSEEVNKEGIKYYHRLINELLDNNIAPSITLYHWDLPQYLEDEGGWCNRDTCYAFERFAEVCFKEFGERVKYWVTINEPWCISQLGYNQGIHAPGRKSRVLSYNVFHHLNLAHGLAVSMFRAMKLEGDIGIIVNPILPRPATQDKKNIEAAKRISAIESRVVLDPIFGLGYPTEVIQYLGNHKLPIFDGDMDIIKSKIDFIGVNYYSERAIVWDDSSSDKVKYVRSYHGRNSKGWHIVPQGLYRALKYIKEEYNNPPVYVTGNGYSCNDRLSEDEESCSDTERINYLRENFKVLSKAISDGFNIKGYYLWSFIDSFEWDSGYTKRFGIVHCNYNDFRRVPKDSYYYYREVIAGHENSD